MIILIHFCILIKNFIFIFLFLHTSYFLVTQSYKSSYLHHRSFDSKNKVSTHVSSFVAIISDLILYKKIYQFERLKNNLWI